jgi:PAS domain S-box-containing protein
MDARYRGLLEAAPDAMVVVNQGGDIVQLNFQAERQFGYSRDELLGQKMKNIVPEGFAERLIADGARTASEALAQQIGTGIELHGRRKDGSEFPIEIMLSPLESAEGTLVTAAIRNISVRKVAEAHTELSEARYRGLLEAAPDAMVVVNQGGEIVLLNLQAERQFGYSRDELLGQQVKNIVPEGFAERLIADSARTASEALTQQIGTGIELHGRRKDGSEFPIEIMLSPLKSAEGTLVTAAIRDISTRKRTEGFKEEFLSHVSHELRSPLSAIRQFVTILLDKLAGELNLEQRQYLEIVLRNAKQLQSMVDDLFEVSGIEAGKLRVELQHTSASDAIGYAVNTLQGAATAKHITLSCNIESPLPSVFADPARVRQILLILMDNAIKFTPPNGAVKIRARVDKEDSRHVVVEVSDSGPGISPDMTERIFERLIQASDPGSAGRKGLGLGLFICKELVMRQGGQIRATCAPGQGAMFTVTLPIFSLPNIIAPAYKSERQTEGPVTLVLTEMGSQTGWLSEEVRAEHYRTVQHLLRKCLLSDLDVLLPKMGSAAAVELFFIVARTDAIGGEAISKRIHERLVRCDQLQQAGLAFVTSCRSLGTTRRKPDESMEEFLKNMAASIQELINEEMVMRTVENG